MKNVVLDAENGCRLYDAKQIRLQCSYSTSTQLDRLLPYQNSFHGARANMNYSSARVLGGTSDVSRNNELSGRWAFAARKPTKTDLYQMAKDTGPVFTLARKHNI
ncbi:7979_t:CDS:2 [Paraglomus occultum]|uniref:7979_t:CDS:1 n=1 Tax=Paraglomus occultum TaxID=144539 RepID=A0A9N9BQK0_9GLOM|nr:7979_t:CDS:2 [Paraglomus occultum]